MNNTKRVRADVSGSRTNCNKGETGQINADKSMMTQCVGQQSSPVSSKHTESGQ